MLGERGRVHLRQPTGVSPVHRDGFFCVLGSLHLEASRRPTGQQLRQRQAQQVRRCGVKELKQVLRMEFLSSIATQRSFVRSFIWQLARMKSRSCPCSLSRRLSCDRVTQIDLAEVDCTKPQSIFSSLHGGVTRATDMRLVGKARVSVRIRRRMRIRLSVIVVLGMLFAECDPFCALQAHWTVSRSRPPLRLLRTGEPR